MMKLSKLYKRLLIILVLGLILLLVFLGYNQASSSSNQETEIQLAELVREVEIINSSLPIKIDDNTVLLSIGVSNGNLIKKFQLPLYKKSDISNSVIHNQIIPSLIKESCNDVKQAYFFNNGISMFMKYYDQNDLFLFEILVSHEDCLTQFKNKKLHNE